jgi:tetratricopeptide (TPR) repeat protein
MRTIHPSQGFSSGLWGGKNKGGFDGNGFSRRAKGLWADNGVRLNHVGDVYHHNPGRWERARGRWDNDLGRCFRHGHFRDFDDFCFVGWCSPWWCGSWWWGGWGWPYYVCPPYYYYDEMYYSSPYDYTVIAPAGNASYDGYASYPPPAQQPAADLAAISAAFRDGDVVGAEAQLSVALRAHPYDAQLSYIYAYVLAFDGRCSSAAMMLRRALVLDPNMLKMGNVILDGFYQAGQASAVLQHADACLLNQANDTEALLTRAYLRMLVGQNDGARSDLEQVLGLNRDDLEAAHLLKMLGTGALTESNQ